MAPPANQGSAAAQLPAALPSEVELLVQDEDGPIRLTVGRQQRDISVRVEAPGELLSGIRQSEAPLSSALEEDGYTLEEFQAEANDSQEQQQRRDAQRSRATQRQDEPSTTHEDAQEEDPDHAIRENRLLDLHV